MTEAEVRLSAKTSFRVDDGDMTLSANAIDGTTKLIVPGASFSQPTVQSIFRSAVSLPGSVLSPD